MVQNKDLVADAQTLLEGNLSEKKSLESARRLTFLRSSCFQTVPKASNKLYVLARISPYLDHIIIIIIIDLFKVGV